eukprot:361335-Chlamydomonas_euryale.AAC.8
MLRLGVHPWQWAVHTAAQEGVGEAVHWCKAGEQRAGTSCVLYGFRVHLRIEPIAKRGGGGRCRKKGRLPRRPSRLLVPRLSPQARGRYQRGQGAYEQRKGADALVMEREVGIDEVEAHMNSAEVPTRS